MSTEKLLITDRKGVFEAYGKSEKEVAEYVTIVRDWLKTQPHLPEIPNDRMIEAFLVTNKFSIERTKPKLDMYYTIRTLIPELYKDRNPSLPIMQDAFNMGMCIPLPKLTKELYRVNMVNITGAPEKFDTYIFYSHMFNLYEVRTQEDVAVGDVLISDLKEFKMGHMSKLTVMHVKKGATVLEEVFSNRVKAVYLLNSPPFVDLFLNLAKAVLKPKLMRRIHLLNSIEELQQHVSKEVLPRDYGGDELSLQELNDLWKLKLNDYKDRFDTLDRLKVKEELRPQPLKNDEILGFHGNFKKLSVD